MKINIEVIKRWAFVPMLLLLCGVLTSVIAPHAPATGKWIGFAVGTVLLGYGWDRRRQRTWPR